MILASSLNLGKSDALMKLADDLTNFVRQAARDGASLDDVERGAFARVLEVRLLLAALGLPKGSGVRFQFSLWQGGLPMDAVPQQGWIAMKTTDPARIGD